MMGLKILGAIDIDSAVGFRRRSRPEEKERSSAQQNQSHGDRPRRLWLINRLSGLAKRGAALGGRMVRIHLPQRRVA